MPAPDDTAGNPHALAAEVRALAERVEAVHRRVERDGAAARRDAQTIRDALEHVYDDDRGARRDLRALLATVGYDEAFTDPAPLVSVVIPTWRNVEMLMARAIPSALAQTHRAIEVIVVGDQSPDATRDAIDRLGDARVRFENLTIRGPYEERDERRAWLASGTPGYNAGVALAQGRWIAPLGDDDAFEPDHVSRLLDRARESHAEFVYGRIRQIAPDGTESVFGVFPPELGRINLQASVYHAGLRFLELEFGHSVFDTPNDWGLIRRMMRAGVRITMVQEAGLTYWPSPRGFQTPPEEEPLDAPLPRTGLAERPMAAGRSAEQARADELQAEVAALQRRLDDVRRSRSWRLTTPLRRIRRRGGP